MDAIARYNQLYRLPWVGFIDDVTAGIPLVPARRWESKLGGPPYLLKGEAWPTRTTRRGPEPLAFLGQLDLAEVDAFRTQEGIPELLGGHLPRHGLLQFFLPEEDCFGNDGTHAFGPTTCRWIPYVVRDDAALEPATVVETDDNGAVAMVPEAAEAPRYPHGLLASTGRNAETTPLEVARFPIRLRPCIPDGREPLQLPHRWSYDFPADLQALLNSPAADTPEIDAFASRHVGHGGTQLDGYPHWTQGDPRETEPEPRRVLLFQLDGGSAVTIGDAGIMGFYIPVEDLPTFRLDRVGMYWDCC